MTNKTSVWINPIGKKIEDVGIEKSWWYITREHAELIRAQIWMMGSDCKRANEGEEWRNLIGWYNAYGFGVAFILGDYHGAPAAFRMAFRDDGTLIPPDVWKEEQEK